MAIFAYLLIIPLFLFMLLFVALGLIPLCVKPDRLRPPWWDWGMDKSEPAAKVEAAPEPEIAPVVTLEKVSEVATPEAMKPELPRW